MTENNGRYILDIGYSLFANTKKQHTDIKDMSGIPGICKYNPGILVSQKKSLNTPIIVCLKAREMEREMGRACIE